MIGIDSISRLNLIRAMPETYEHLESSGWFELRGYNKMDDNTFPNLMAILTGQNMTVNNQKCDRLKVGEIEKCRFLWKDFSAAGYATAYAEDETTITTFNYEKPGFIKQPTDYYLRPFGMAIEKHLKMQKRMNLKVCVGFEHYADVIYRYALDFGTKFKNQPSFGLFWTNSFSHEDLSMTSSMDGRMKYYLLQLESLGILETSIVIFFSDHGMRFGPIRKHFTGWLEERLPFIYIWLPEKFKAKHPEFAKNLETNRDRLSSPFDVHITLQHILQISGGFDENLSAISCPKCQSLFEELPMDRGCSDAGIDRHWCTCEEFKIIDKSLKAMKSVTHLIVKKINADLSAHPKCAKLKVNEIYDARQSVINSSNYRISFNVMPSKGELEATIRCDTDCRNIEIIGSVSRLDRYGEQSRCVKDSKLKLYCFCQ